MRLDHVSFAAQPDGLRATAARLASTLGIRPVDGGVHPRFGTRNVILPLDEERYVEVVEVLDHPASDKAPFGQAVRACSQTGGGWLCWVVAVQDLTPFERQLGYEAPPGNRRRPDGIELRWHQIGVKGLITDPQLPFAIRWDTGPELHPSVGADPGVRLVGLEIAGDPARVRDWLSLDPSYAPSSLAFEFVAPQGAPGIRSVSFETRTGLVRI